MAVVWNEGEAYRLLEAPGGPVYRHVETITAATLSFARALCPHRTGRTAASLRSDVRSRVGRVTGRVYSDEPVVRYLESGTGLRGPEHRLIRSRTGRMMGPIEPPYPRFLRQQRGMSPQRFLRRALALASPYPVRDGDGRG